MAKRNQAEELKDGEKVEKDKSKDKVVPLRLVPGGRPPGSPDWLSSLEIGTVFLVRPKAAQGPFIEEYHVIAKTEKAVRLHTNTQGEIDLWTIPSVFCSLVDLYEIIGHNPSL